MSIVPLPHSHTFSAKSDQLTLGDAVDSFLTDRDLSQTSQRVYRTKLGLVIRQLGAETPLYTISPAQLHEHVRATYTTASPRTWNHALAVLRSFYAYAIRQGWVTSSPAMNVDRRRERLGREVLERTRAIPEDQLRRFLGASHPLREKTLWWLLYESAARAEEALQLDIEHVDLSNRRATIIGKGGRAENIAWETTTARLLPRLIGSRRRGPVFLADLAPSPSRQPASADRCPDTGRARLSYRRAAELFTTASNGWTLHQLRHSRLTHLSEHGVDITLLRAISRHHSLRTLERYARPTLDAAALAASRFDPATRARSSRLNARRP